MQILLKSALVIDPSSSCHLQRLDVLVKDGRIEEMAVSIENDGSKQEISSANLCVSKGWFDLNVLVPDPGQEHREDLVSAAKAAAFGGFTSIAIMPNTTPALHSKTEIDYILNKSAGLIIDVHAIGAVTKDCAGKDLTEMVDMYEAGAVAFSNGYKAVSHAGIMERALEYMKAFDGTLFHHPEEVSISNKGHMHEGAMSVSLGLPASPGLAESLCVARDLYLLEYTGSKLHFTDISTAESVSLIREAKKKGLHVTASVNAYHLMLEDSALVNFDSNLKVNPPLRGNSDRIALIEGLIDGTIDTICSGHIPHDAESKELEFDLADFGMIALETAFATANSTLRERMAIEQIVGAFTSGPEKVLGEYCYSVEKGNPATITFFDPDLNWTFNAAHIQSRSKNTPFVGQAFIGKPLGIVNKKKLYLSPA
jgi:dihydroorotase